MNLPASKNPAATLRAGKVAAKPEDSLVWDYFDRAPTGFFLDVGANHPIEGNQTWLLEERGWTGVLVEPHPEMAALLRKSRPRSRVFEAAVGRPEQAGLIDFYLGQTRSSPRPDLDVRARAQIVSVALRTLDAILDEAGATRIDFLSLDVEGMELDALAGLDLQKWEPRLILLEDFFYNHSRHRYLRAKGYKLVRRTSYNNWYVPQDARASVLAMNSPSRLFHLYRKMWFSGPLIGWRRRLRGRKA